MRAKRMRDEISSTDVAADAPTKRNGLLAAVDCTDRVAVLAALARWRGCRGLRPFQLGHGSWRPCPPSDCSWRCNWQRTRGSGPAGEVAALVVMASIAAAMALCGARNTEAKSTPWTFVLGLGIFAALTVAGAIRIVVYSRHLLAERPDVSDHAGLLLRISGWATFQLVLVATDGNRIAVLTRCRAARLSRDSGDGVRTLGQSAHH